ncbi:S28 family serine protease [Nannocystis punicea]|uniref:S28 family serine protease n=1 Tax=Nannocystis punicea TaxID=2995304 RepID=A0ABY7GTF5_9BACT|nr:S28 family serine protease [Nannocystis poenicansa]WAS90215.1 S28 family serine protease [Nannocystis poenicansa]
MRFSYHSLAIVIFLQAAGCDAPGGQGGETDAGTTSTAAGPDPSGEVGTTTTTGETSTGEPTTTGGEPTTTTGEPTTTTGGDVDILEQLTAIDGLWVDELPTPIAGYRLFTMLYEQPADHDAQGGPSFNQRMTLLHRDVDAPLVIVTAGYNINTKQAALGEPATMVGANQLTVEHRFFEESRPSMADWTKLDIRQAASDHHRIAAALHPLYPGRWLATGASKGGLAALYFRRFFPDDVDGTIAYVAPYSREESDPRYGDFLATVGDEACRQALRDVQREVLLRRSAMLERMAAVDATYTLFGVDEVLETAALDLPFAFWQYQSASLCASVPTAVASDDEVWAFLKKVSEPSSDADLLRVEPYYWQAATQLGGVQCDESGVADLLLFPGFNEARNFIVPGPGKTPGPYDPAAAQDVADWLASAGERLLFVYGESDPWTAGAFELGDAVDSYLFTAPGTNHGALIADLDDADRAQAVAAVEAWAGTRARSDGLVRPAPIRETLQQFGW